MEVFKLVVLVAPTILLATVTCSTVDDSTDTAEAVVDAVNRLNPLQEASPGTDLHQAVTEDDIRKNCEAGDSIECEAPSVPHGEKSTPDIDTADAAGTETEGSEVSGKRRRNDPLEGESLSDAEGETETTKPPPKVVLQAFGAFDTDDEEEEADEQSGTKGDEEIWTEQTEDGIEQKRSGGRRFFSLMNLIKFLLNPVIEEFQEMEKSSTSQDAATATDTNNQSEVAGMPAGNASDIGDKEKKNGTESGKKTKFQCMGRNVTENTTATVRIVNSTVLLELLSFDKNHTTSDCVLVMFYAPWCHFCAATAPHYNAVARAFPQLEVLAVDTVHFSNLNARFGTVAVPNIMLFHQSRSAVRFNHTERHFETLLQFITNTTGLEANSSVELSPEDYEGPLSSTPTEETDYLLWFAWFFIVICSGHIFISSQVGQHAIERVMVLWQEHQHQHIE